MNTITPKQLNAYERRGLRMLIMETFHFDCDKFTVGTSQKGMLNLQNTQISQCPEGYPKIGAIGLAKNLDVLIEYWDYEEQNSKTYSIAYSVCMTADYPWRELTEVELNSVDHE